MRARAFDPTRLDVAAFAAEGAELGGAWPLRALDRVLESAAPEALPAEDQVVNWRVRGEQTAAPGGGAESWLHLDASAALDVTCQRCLQPVHVPMDVHRRILFVPGGEDAAAAVDAEREEDVLPLTRALDLRELVEDELLLALPLVPVHAVCAEPLAAPDSATEEGGAPNPFAALAALKRGGGSG
jgi:uncharacterized protein